MKVVQINATCGKGSTGKICVGISQLLTQNGIENYILYCSGTSNYPIGIKCSDDKYIKIQALKSLLLGNYGFNSKRLTFRIINELDRICPDVVHLHNIHGHDCNLKLLFMYFKRKNIKLVWTFHDCWAFTAYCPHFAMVGCDKWKTGCFDCQQKRKFSWIFDNSPKLFQNKKNLFSGLDLTIVTPSNWLAGLVKDSFLNNYPVKIIRNGIDLSVFKPTTSDFRKEYGIPDSKFIILCVSFNWSNRKGLDVFVELEKLLPPDKYQIVLVGTNSTIDKQLPDGIITIHRTQNTNELVKIYSSSDLFVNPTREDNYPTVNMESVACGTPVLTFKTGGSPEMIDETCGSVVEQDDIAALIREIIRISEDLRYTKENCVSYAEKYDQNVHYKKYVNLYYEILK